MVMTEESEQAAAAKPMTVAAFERLKWETECAFRERELKIKEHESRPAIWKNALFMSVAAAVVGVIAHTAGTVSDNMAQRTVETERLQASLIQKALELDDPMRVLTKLRLLYNSGLITVYHDNVRRLMESDDNAQYFTPTTDTGRQYQAALIEKAIENDDLSRVLKKLQMLDDADLIPDFSKTSKLRDMLRASRDPASIVVAALPDKPGMGASSPVPVAPPPPVAPSVVPPPTVPPLASASPPAPSATPGDTTRAVAPNPCAAATVNPAAAGGWIFLGWTETSQDHWVDSPSGTKSLSFDGAPRNPDKSVDLGKLSGQCLRTLSVKYLRDEGAPGQKAQAAVKRTLRPGTHLRIVEVDSAGVDDHTNSRYPVIWAKVEVLAE
jgi:hypothetical protein